MHRRPRRWRGDRGVTAAETVSAATLLGPRHTLSASPSTSDEPVQREWAVDLRGSRIQVRPLGPDDYDAIVSLSLFLSDRDRYLRFFTTHPNHLDEWARSLAAVNDRTRVALGAFEDNSLVGIASYVGAASAASAEVSVLVAHDQHDRGIGTAILRILGTIARTNGFHHLTADVLAENNSMCKVISDAGWPCTRHRDGGVVHVDVNLDAVSATTPSPPSPVARRCEPPPS